MQHQFMVDKAGQLLHVIDNEVRAIVEKDHIDEYVKGQGFEAQLAHQRVEKDLEEQRKAAEKAAASGVSVQDSRIEDLVAKAVAKKLAEMDLAPAKKKKAA